MSKLAIKRKEAKLSQSQLAAMAEISVRSLQNWEIGHRNINTCPAITAYKLARALGCHIEEILEVEEEQ